MPKSRIRPVNEPSEVLKVSWNAVGQVSLEVRPDKFIGIKLRRISGEVNGVDPRITSKESLRELGCVERAAVPEEDKRASDLAARMPEEFPDLLGPNVSVGIKTGAEAEMFSPGRDRNGGDGRYLCPLSSDNEGWSFSSNRPGSLNVGDKRKPTFIKEDKAGVEPSGVFLYAAKRNASSDESLSPCVPEPASVAFERSSLSCSLNSKGFRCSNALRNSCGLLGRSVSKSKDPLNNRLPEVLSPGCLPRFSSVFPTNAGFVLDAPWALSLPVPSFRRLGANGLRSLWRRSLPWRPNRRCCLASRDGRPTASFSLVVEGFHGVS